MLGLGSDLSPAPAQALWRDGSAQVRSGPTQQDLTTSLTSIFSCSAKIFDPGLGSAKGSQALRREGTNKPSVTNQPVKSPTGYKCLEPGRRSVTDWSQSLYQIWKNQIVGEEISYTALLYLEGKGYLFFLALLRLWGASQSQRSKK